MNDEAVMRILSLLGIARKARELVIGQDKIFEMLRGDRKLFAIVTEDCSQNVLRKVRAASCEIISIEGLTGERLGAAIGVNSAKIVALPSGCGFTKKILELSK